MTNKTSRNSKRVTVVLFVVIVLVAICIPNTSLAVTTDGIVSWNEITPPNNILYSNFQTGIEQNYDNVEGYACCGKFYEQSSGLTVYGVIYATSNANTQNITVKNIYGVDLFSNPEVYWSYTYNGITIYFNTSYMDPYNTAINNYTYAEFSNEGGFHPTNSIANSLCQKVYNDTIYTSNINYSLPAGNVAIIQTNSNYTEINLTTTMPLQSTSFANNPWPNTTQRIGYYNTLPQSINPNSMGNTIEWERSGNTTLFNITTNAKYNPSVVSTFKYVIIANPYYYPANDMEDSQYTNGAINISMDGVVNITVKSLTATVNTQTGAVEDNYNGEEWTGEIDETTSDIIWTDGNGDNNAPTSGGNLSDPSITGFQSWLKGILNNIVNIFQPAHDAINTLSGAVNNFASWMYALYVWLPSPILSLLTSAISLAIVIGIIKVFI